MSLAASLMTATFVKARNEFRDAGITASIGRYAFGFTWGAWAAMFLAVIFLSLGVVKGKDTTTRTTKRSFFRRNRSRRSGRGSFIDNDSQRRVKDEYA
jgi:heme exporter protein D